jgi:ubiquitin C-terminal hydrolase
MFGLKNYGGSCWLNACLQSILRIPEITSRYSTELETINSVDKSLYTISKTQGQDGLKDLFNAISETNSSVSGSKPAYEMLAGKSVGDTNEAFIYLCDKLSFLDTLCRYTIVEKIECKCGFEQEKNDSHIQFEIYPIKDSTLTSCITQVVSPEVLDSWKCDKCSERGQATKRMIMKTFPTCLVFKIFSEDNSVVTPQNLVINSNKYELASISCWNGGHWWAYSKLDTWALYDDTRVHELKKEEIPSSRQAKMLIYYRTI